MRLARLLIPLLVLTALFIPLSAAAVGAKKALIVGNGLYRHGPDLRNPVPDARAMAGTLDQLGYAVTYAENLTLREMSTLLASFSRSLAPRDTVVVFFAGQGVLVDGTTYLLPTDALMRDEHDLITAFPVSEILDVLRKDLHAGVVLIDACRDNPLLQLASTRSMHGAHSTPSHAIRLPFGVVIGYAAQPGAVAYDGDGAHSPYVTSLLKHMTRPGVDVEMMLRDVRRDVLFATDGAQVTWTQSSLLDGFSLAELPPDPVAMPAQPDPERLRRLSTLRQRLCSALVGGRKGTCN